MITESRSFGRTLGVTVFGIERRGVAAYVTGDGNEVKCQRDRFCALRSRAPTGRRDRGTAGMEAVLRPRAGHFLANLRKPASLSGRWLRKVPIARIQQEPEFHSPVKDSIFSVNREGEVNRLGWGYSYTP